ncbi:glycosyltransferase [Candidatus Nitrotoga sp. 1052]|uniref:glycosyltransferase n=1 Tax=Candidatus Nitrotoga sp. 1052 TaxID=2886964 RepID=UPI001EF60FF0|nr:glycosyltransferase [Candidatus Nitrotoga sp. 1052]CAH1077464.1 putative enzyme [Candidatus Nitrotoga sp. 1052]
MAAYMIFDQYSRYKACSDLLRQTGFVADSSVLDVGSGPECLLGQFMPEAAMTYVDPLIPSGSGQGHITGNIFVRELDGQSFDFVSAVDVLEHIPSEHRQAFLERMSSLGKNTLILGFPTSDSSDALETDKAIDDQYSAIFGHEYSWLEEHYRYGLPSMAGTVGQLSQLGWHCQTVGHGHAPWLRELLGFVICVWDIPSLSNVVLAISEKFNRELYPYDFRPPYYRQFVIASRSPLPHIIAPVTSNNIEAADDAFRVLMEDAQRQYFTASLRQLVERDAQIAALNQKIEEVSVWGATQQATVVERDAQIAALNQTIEEVSIWGATQQAAVVKGDAQVTSLNQKIEEVSCWGRLQHEKNISLEQALSDKQAELMKMSDWAHGMMLELNRRNASIVSRFEKSAKRGGVLARKKLAQSFLGDMVRHVRDSRHFREKRVSLEVIRQSVLDNRGRLIITFPIITWDFRWQRPQHIVSRLRNRGFSVLYVAMSLTALGHRLRGSKEAFTQICFNELAPHVNQIWLNSSKQLNIYTDPIEGDDLHNISIGLNALISDLRPQSIIYLVQFPGWGPVAQDLQKKLGGKVVFDCMDDHGGFSTNTAQALKTEEVLMQNADLVVASSNLLEKRAKVLNPNTIQVKNGTEFDHFTNPTQNGYLDHFCDRPIIGYYGAISDWFDMKLVAHCASQRPDWNFVLIGATFGADLQPVEGMKNVHFLGEKPYKELPGYLAYFDVCTIPFKVIPLTLATNPVKFYEYLSSGKPIVSIELPELLSYQEDCYLACNPDEFLAQLERAYNERKDEKLIGRRLKLASENSWDARVSAILESEIFKTYL